MESKVISSKIIIYISIQYLIFYSLINEKSIITSHYTNNIAEAQFRQLKHTVCSGRLKLSINEFIECLTIKTQLFFEGRMIERGYQKRWISLPINDTDEKDEEDIDEEEEDIDDGHIIERINDDHIMVDGEVIHIHDMNCSCSNEHCPHIIILIERYKFHITNK